MKILAIGDPHGAQFKLPNLNPDYVFLTGDVCSNPFRDVLIGKEYTEAEFERGDKEMKDSADKFLNKVKKNYSCPIFLIRGNADGRISRDKWVYSLARKYNITLIGNKVIAIEKYKLLGIDYILTDEWINRFGESKTEEEIECFEPMEKELISLLNKERVDIILSHSPPYKVLDKVNGKNVPKSWQGKHAGLIVLRDYILKQSPLLCVCSHIHESKGIKKLGKTVVVNVGSEGSYAIIDIDREVTVDLK